MDATLAAITIQQIRIFIKVAETGGFAKASVYLNMTQSAVSKSIAKMEKELGLALFERTTRENRLTDAGELLYREWNQSLKDIQNSYIKALSIYNEEGMVLHVGLLNSARPDYFWKIEEQYTEKYPNVNINLKSLYIPDLEKALIAGEADCIMIPDFERFAIDEMGLNWKWAARRTAYVLVHKSHRLATCPEVTLMDLANEEFVTLHQQERHCYKRDLEERFRPLGVKPRISISYQNPMEIRYLFQRSMNVILFMDEFFDWPENPDYKRIAVTDQKNGIICAWHPDNHKKVLQNFLKVLKG